MNGKIRKATIIVSAAAGLIFIIFGIWAMVTMLNYYSVMSEVVDDSAAAADKFRSVTDACGLQYGMGLLFLCITGLALSTPKAGDKAASNEKENTEKTLEEPQKEKTRKKREKHQLKGFLRGKKQAVDEEKADEFQIPEEPENTQENEEIEPVKSAAEEIPKPQSKAEPERPEKEEKQGKIGKEELKAMLKEALDSGAVTEDDIHAGNIVIVTKDGKRAMKRKDFAEGHNHINEEELRTQTAELFEGVSGK